MTTIEEVLSPLELFKKCRDSEPTNGWASYSFLPEHIEVIQTALRQAEQIDGGDYVLVPRELTAENGMKAALIGEFFEEVTRHDVESDEYWTEKIYVSWPTIKEIHSAMIAAQEDYSG